MSIDAALAALNKDLPCNEKFILTVLAIRRNGRTGLCCPSKAQLSKDTGLSRATVTRVITRLEKKGLIVVIRRRGTKGTQLVNHYELPGLPLSPSPGLTQSRAGAHSEPRKENRGKRKEQHVRGLTVSLGDLTDQIIALCQGHKKIAWQSHTYRFVKMWVNDWGISPERLIPMIQDILDRKTDGLPGSPKYFNAALYAELQHQKENSGAEILRQIKERREQAAT